MVRRARYQHPIPETPECFPSRQSYVIWKELARVVSPGTDAFCADCTPEYKREMIKQSCCAFPTVIFLVDKDGFIHGSRKPMTAYKTKKKQIEERA